MGKASIIRLPRSAFCQLHARLLIAAIDTRGFLCHGWTWPAYLFQQYAALRMAHLLRIAHVSMLHMLTSATNESEPLADWFVHVATSSTVVLQANVAVA